MERTISAGGSESAKQIQLKESAQASMVTPPYRSSFPERTTAGRQSSESKVLPVKQRVQLDVSMQPADDVTSYGAETDAVNIRPALMPYTMTNFQLLRPVNTSLDTLYI